MNLTVAAAALAIATAACSGDGDPTTTNPPTTQPAGPTTAPETGSTVLSDLNLQPRPGDQPSVTTGIPHIQLDQGSSDDVFAELTAWAFSRDGIVELPSLASLPGALALTVAQGLALNPQAMLVAREFAHIHPQPDGGSLHLRLPAVDAQEVVDQGWGEYHPFALDGTIPNLVMVYAPRDAEDLDVVKTIIEASIEFATSADDA